jgi:hypothetical protein
MEAEAAEELAAWLVDECEKILEKAKSGPDIRLATHALLTLARFGGFVECGPNPALLAYDWILRVHANESSAAARLTARLRRCGARRKRDGQPCLAKPLHNGRCKLHGGMSTGPKTPKGRVLALANLRQNRISARR